MKNPAYASEVIVTNKYGTTRFHTTFRPLAGTHALEITSGNSCITVSMSPAEAETLVKELSANVLSNHQNALNDNLKEDLK